MSCPYYSTNKETDKQGNENQGALRPLIYSEQVLRFSRTPVPVNYTMMCGKIKTKLNERKKFKKKKHNKKLLIQPGPTTGDFIFILI